MQVSLKRSGQDEMVCLKSYQTLHLGGETEGIAKVSVEFALGIVVCERRGLLCNTGDD